MNGCHFCSEEQLSFHFQTTLHLNQTFWEYKTDLFLHYSSFRTAQHVCILPLHFYFLIMDLEKEKEKTPACFYLLEKKLLLMKFLILVWKTTLRTMDKYRFVVLIQKRPIVFFYQELRSGVTILKKCSRKVMMCSVSTKVWHGSLAIKTSYVLNKT